MMSTDVSHPSISTTVKTVIVPVNQGPIDTGVRLPVEQITLDELERRRQADAAQACAATAALPSNVAVLQGMIVELREALAGQTQRVTELEQAMHALLQRLLRKPHDDWPADQLGLFPEMHSPELTPEPTPPPAAAAPPEPEATEATGPSKKKKKGHGRRSLEELLKSLPLQRREHVLTEAELLCPCCGRPRRKIGEQTSQQLEYIPARLVCVQHAKIEVGCWSHAERYFEAATDSDPVRAAEGLGFIHALFALEAQAKRGHLAETEVLALRQREAVPIPADFKLWLEQTRPQVLPKSPMHDALRYTINQWEALRRYSDTGFVALDNNATERINKLIARGRVNRLFVGSPRGGETAARLLSLVVSCRRLHMDSFLYLRDVFTRLPSLPADRLDDLLPARWLASHPEARHPPERQGHGHTDPRPRRRRRPT